MNYPQFYKIKEQKQMLASTSILFCVKGPEFFSYMANESKSHDDPRWLKMYSNTAVSQEL